MKAHWPIGLLFLAVAAVASATPLTWTISNAVFDDGGTLSGSFTFDADTGSISNWNLVTSAGSTLSGFNYIPSSSTADFLSSALPVCTANCYFFNRNDNLLYVLLEFPSALTDSGGTVNLVLGSNNPNASYECTNCGSVRLLVSGSVSAPLSQTITFNAPGNVTLPQSPFSIASDASASSGLTVQFSSNSPSVCTVNVDDVVSVLTIGTCSITANQPGNSSYQAAPPVTRTFQVFGEFQSITFNPLSNVTFGVAPFTISATASSGLTVTFTSNTTTVCTVSSTTVTIAAGGICSITASQAGNSTFAAANPVTQTFTVLAASQTIAFDAIPNQIFGISPFEIAAQSSALQPVSFASTTPAVCTTASTTVMLLNTGTCSITASQSGTTDFAAAPPVTKSFSIAQAMVSGRFVAAAQSPFQAGTNPYSVAVGDFNGDGKPDLAVANSGSNNVTVLLGDGTGGFTARANSPFAVGNAPQSVAVGDFNADGKQDIAVANSGDNTVTILLGDGMGGFSAGPNNPTAVGTKPVALAVGDLNGDGIQDVAVANNGGGSVLVLVGDGSGGFILPRSIPLAVGNNPSAIALADFNGDGNPDIAVANAGDNTVTILLGNGSGVFSPAGSPVPVGTAPSAIAVGDFNGDGVADLAVANSGSGNITVLLGNGAGGFLPSPNSPFHVNPSPRSLAVLDFNGDKIQDLVVASTVGNVSVLIGDGNGNFAAGAGGPFAGGPFPVGASPFSVAVADFNGDGYEDVATANDGDGTVSVLLGAKPIPPLTITASPATINTTVGGSAAASVAISGGLGPYTITTSGAVPGISVNTGGLSGSPTQAGNFAVTFAVADSSGLGASVSVTINVLGLTTTSLPDGTAGQAYAASIGAAGGTGAYSFSGSGLPAGLSLTNDGYVSGTITAVGSYTFNVSVTSNGLTASGSVSLAIDKPKPLAISNASPGGGQVNVPYSGALAATGGVAPYLWAVNSGSLPPGLSLSSAGIVSGTPTTPGTFSFGVTVTDNAGATATATASIAIQAAPLKVTTASLPSGMYGVPYPPQQLSVSGGVAPFTWVVSSGSLPEGMGLSSAGILSGTPQAPGTASSSMAKKIVAHDSSTSGDSYTVGLTVTDNAGTQTTVTFPLIIRQKGADLILTAGALTFAVSTPATTPPAPQVVGVQSTVASQPLNYTLAVNPAVTWLSVMNGTVTPDSIQVSITSAGLMLAVGTYTTTLTATCTSASCSGHMQSVSVTLNVTAAPPKLQISTSLVALATTNTSPGLVGGTINVSNSGGGSLGFASVACEAPWCSVGAAPQSLSGGAAAAIAVTADPVGLGPGFYRTQVDIISSGGKGAVPVTLFIAANATMTLAPVGAQFNMLAGGAPGNPNGSFLVAVNSTTTVNWTASIVAVPGVPIPSWLALATSAGSSTTSQPGAVSFGIDPTAASSLAPGAYYGAIQVASADVNNSPLDFEVVLNVGAANSPVAPEPQPGGLLFITTVGGVLPPETVTVYSASTTTATFQASAAATTGGNWLSVAPSTGNSSSSSPGITTVSVDTSNLAAGVYQGGVSYALSATAVRTVNVTLIVTPAGGSGASAVSASSKPKAAGCTPSTLVPAQTGLVNSFSQPAGWPTPLQIVLSTDCGTLINNGQIVATFSNGDPPLPLPLANAAQGLYSGTWSPARASSQVSIAVTANAPGFRAATSQITGTVVPNAVPVITPNGTVHSFDPLVGGSLAPGTIVAIYGQNLAASAAQASTIPLPTTYNSTTVLIGGMQAPLYYVSPSQVNAQIPFELLPGSQYNVLISANGALTNPQPIQLTAATPGLAAFSDGTLIAQHSSDGSLVSSSSPARGGEYLIAYLAGLGDTNVDVPSGTASPSNPLAQPIDPPVLTINGSQYPIAFAGLTPGLVGLYQMNFQAPAGLTAGNLTLTVSQSGLSSNQTVLPYQP